MRKKLIAMLAAGVMLAQAIPALAVSGTTEEGLKYYKEDFESYAIGEDYNGQNGWTTWTYIKNGTVNTNKNYTAVLVDPSTGGGDNKAGALVDVDTGNADSSANTYSRIDFDAMDGSSAGADGFVTVEFRWLQNKESKQSKIALKDGDTTIAYVWVHPGCNCGLCIGAPTSGVGGSISQAWNAPNFCWGSTNDDGTYTTKNTWNTIKFELDFNTETIKAYWNGSAKGDTFYFAAEEITKIDNIALSSSADANAAIYLDDIYVVEGKDKTIADVVDMANYGVSAVHNNTSGTVRFASKVMGGDADSAGACVVPTRLFADDFEAANVARVSVSSAVANGETFGADITGIPASEFDTQLIAKPFVVVDGDVIWAQYTQTTSVNAAIN